MKNLAIFVLNASKRTTVDRYDHGCEIGTEKEQFIEHQGRYESVVDVFRDLMGDKSITGKLVSTIDPNIYCDPRGGGPPRTVEDNQSKGIFRCNCDRMENKRGRKPSKNEMRDFEERRDPR